MDILISIMKLCAGIGMFLFAMYLIEESLKNLSGRNFKRFLQYVTKNRFGAVAGGAIVAALLQSSSMVSLMVLAFVGAGVFTMKNAVAIILGANLGTIITGWLIATLGFGINIEVAAYPCIFIGGLMLILLGKYKSVKYISNFLLGFGLLFIGLAFMKTAMEAQVKTFDFSQYADMPLIVSLFIGFIITVLVQASSVTMALTLSALYAGAIDFPMAAAIVLGAEIGTTIKLLISTLDGNIAKKRVVLGNLLYNIFITIVAFALLKPILHLITDVLNISNPLIGLVTFPTIINLFGILFFLIFLNPFTKLLERFFRDTDASAAAFINNATINEPETALDLFRREIAYFIHNAMLFNLAQFEIDTTSFEDNPDFKSINEKRKFVAKRLEEKYVLLKQLQGELQSFYLELRTKLVDEQTAEINQLISAARSAMYSVKSMKDIKNSSINLSSSSKDIKFNFFINHKNETSDLYKVLNAILLQKEQTTFAAFQKIYDDIQNNYSTALNNFYKDVLHAAIEDLDITIAINFNRELFTANKAMLMAIKDLLLDENEAKDFNEVPVYKT